MISLLIFLSALFFLFDRSVKIMPVTEYTKDPNLRLEIIKMRKQKEDGRDLIDVYKDLPLIDVHSHDVHLVDRNEKRIQDYGSYMNVWDTYGIDQTVLFGDISEPSAVQSDRLTWKYYKKYTDYIIPSFAGIPLNKDENGVELAKEKLEQGYLNIGEIIASSTYSPFANVLWKAKHPYDGALPEIYHLAGEYKVPILLHIDPPNGVPINSLKTALKNHPKTTFIFAHGNVYNSPGNLDSLLKHYDNLYIDFYAGFSRYHKGSEQDLENFVPLIEKYPDRFFLGSDSGYDIGLENAYRAMYELIDLLTPETAAMVASENYRKLIEEQPPTDYQIKEIKRLSKQLNLKEKSYRLNKRQANELIFSLEKTK
ncbi:amidohydrolase family protein [Mesobacillus thioparans]|uniref:amidohydrolase family protein n=1 Tax=Mesobacillus thioparans TaxID=370439 RepID=UPI0039EF0A0A